MLAVLFSALAPSLSHAFAAERSSAGLGEICSSYGAAPAAQAAGPAQKPATDALQLHLKHCPYCGTHGASVALLPPALLTFAVLGGHDLFPPLYYRAPAALFSWSAAQPRAPPFSA